MTYMQKYPIPRVSTVHACVALLHLLLEFTLLSKSLVTTSGFHRLYRVVHGTM